MESERRFRNGELDSGLESRVINLWHLMREERESLHLNVRSNPNEYEDSWYMMNVIWNIWWWQTRVQTRQGKNRQTSMTRLTVGMAWWCKYQEDEKCSFRLKHDHSLWTPRDDHLMSHGDFIQAIQLHQREIRDQMLFWWIGDDGGDFPTMMPSQGPGVSRVQIRLAKRRLMVVSFDASCSPSGVRHTWGHIWELWLKRMELKREIRILLGWGWREESWIWLLKFPVRDSRFLPEDFLLVIRTMHSRASHAATGFHHPKKVQDEEFMLQSSLLRFGRTLGSFAMRREEEPESESASTDGMERWWWWWFHAVVLYPKTTIICPPVSWWPQLRSNYPVISPTNREFRMIIKKLLPLVHSSSNYYCSTLLLKSVTSPDLRCDRFFSLKDPHAAIQQLNDGQVTPSTNYFAPHMSHPETKWLPFQKKEYIRRKGYTPKFHESGQFSGLSNNYYFWPMNIFI